MTPSHANPIRERIDNGPLSAVQIFVVLIGFFLNFVDGVDVVAMSVAAPSLTQEWGITPAQKGYILSAALVGMTLGAMFIVPFADKVGRRNILLFATFLIGSSMIVTGLIPQSVELMMLLRMISGLGIGVVFASSAAIGTEIAPERYRNIAVTTIIMGYPFGAMLIGPFANIIIPAQGWQMLFIYGGVFTLLMTVVVYFFLPESVEYLSTQTHNSKNALAEINAILVRMKRSPLDRLPIADKSDLKVASVGSLFAKGFAWQTAGLWVVYFLGFLSVYFLLSWVPTLFVDSGYSRPEGIRALTINNMGAVLGILVIGLTATRIKLAKPVSLFFISAGALLAAIFFFRPQNLLILNVLIFLVGFMQQGAFTAMYALAARVYPTTIRATGIGWSAGLGRTGAIVSPIVAGYLVGAGWSMYSLFLLFGIPLIIAGVIVIFYRH